ncbi:hypothetical protein SAMN05444166_8435 [Singulisphaera sp. GP187]|uniref:hypothetical protein n=1 Tax=Singulisphaera sp. GP187 TaxID=1882752 RepID=UPI000928AFA6|nr:hypothetical protein [Singulisphaera sp. GP187]SIO67739.1 hypothetical protein SAMN05444166_8435 [Singulisphaera sp. GP187]
MTTLRKWRSLAKTFILFFVAWEVVATIVSLALLIIIAVRGGAPSPDRLISVFGTLGLFGVVIWAIRDARERGRRRPLERAATVEEEA